MTEPVTTQTAGPKFWLAFLAAQKEFKPLVKAANNPHFNSKYADLSAVVEAIEGALHKHGLVHTRFLRDEGDKTFMVSQIIHAESGQYRECPVRLVVDKQNMQGMKSACTYASRIGLENVSGLAPEDDDGNAAAAAPPKPSTITADQFIELRDKIEAAGVSEDKILQAARIEALHDLPATSFASVMKRLQITIDKKAEKNDD